MSYVASKWKCMPVPPARPEHHNFVRLAYGRLSSKSGEQKSAKARIESGPGNIGQYIAVSVSVMQALCVR